MNLAQLDGILQIANVFLAVVAGVQAATLFKLAWKKEFFKAWRALIFALLLFAIVEILAALRAFGVYSTPHLTHVLTSVILILLIFAVIMQIDVKKRGIK